MIQLSLRNDDSSLYYDFIITHKKLTYFVIFRVTLITTVRPMYLEIIFPL